MKIWITSNFVQYLDMFIVDESLALQRFKYPHNITPEELIKIIEEHAGEKGIEQMTLSGQSNLLFSVEEYFGHKGVYIIWQ